MNNAGAAGQLQVMCGGYFYAECLLSGHYGIVFTTLVICLKPDFDYIQFLFYRHEKYSSFLLPAILIQLKP
ncbi:hypothetical protein [Erwinia psidii]|uniref:Uncharacterized protein n=1 Tax=Erwinia psidii TaxID=69224 RepID=A0A3N6SGR5_9GAMM|nr:hypothetical protein [Erwinia psidii]MCX8956130.1 hypothetical protein [Erwinia psidii]MCX8960105.1 hypothetical protein [Erwinia psidii]MCX8963651.1 hypothetical protein [Erwinia psidii]RQM39103.1 hypothetical protein EB241_04925 [Erwinia psidii]